MSGGGINVFQPFISRPYLNLRLIVARDQGILVRYILQAYDMRFDKHASGYSWGGRKATILMHVAYIS